MSLVFTTAILVPLRSEAATDFTSWQLTTGVSEVGGPSDGEFSLTVSNPLLVEHAGYLPNEASPLHLARAFYDASWLVEQNTGSFGLTYEHVVGGPRAVVGANGILFLQTDTPILFNLSASMQFSSTAGDWADFLLTMTVRDEPFTTPFFSEGQLGGDLNYGRPPSGTLSLSATDILLPPGTFRISYAARSMSDIFPIQDTMVSNGSFQFSWRPAPEPATAVLLCIACVPALLRRRRR